MDSFDFDKNQVSVEYLAEKLSFIQDNLSNLTKNHRKLLDNIIESVENTEFKDEYVHAMTYRSVFLKRDQKFDESMKLLDRLEEYANRNDLTNQTMIRIFAAYINNYIEQGDVTKALFYSERGLKLAREINDNNLIHMQLFRIGVINLIAENNETALRYFLEDLEYLENVDKAKRIHITLNNIGVALNKLGHHEEAKGYLHRSINLSKEFKDGSCEAASLDELAVILISEENYEEALDYELQSIELFEKQKSIYDVLAVKVSLLSIYRNLDKNTEYIEEKEKIDKQLERYDFNEIKAKFYEEISIFYQNQNDYKNAYESIVKFNQYSEIYKATAVQNELKMFETKTVAQLNEKLKSIGNIGRKISSSRSREIIFEELSSLVDGILSFNILGVALIENQNIINYKYFIEDGDRIQGSKKRIDDKSNLGAWCVRNQMPILIYNLEDEKEKYTQGLETIAHTQKEVTKSVIYVPMMIEDKVLGLLTIQSFEKSRYNQHDLELVEIVAAYVAVALENIKQQEFITLQNKKLIQAATTDALTGLFNRHYFNDTMQKYWDDAYKDAKTLGLIVFDLDYFKSINDTYSHIGGDVCLQALGAILQKYNTNRSFVARVGGEEFAIALYDSSKDEVKKVSEEIRSQIESEQIDFESDVINMSASFGCGIEIPKISKFKSFDKLYSRVDYNLYQAKETGKNRVVYK